MDTYGLRFSEWCLVFHALNVTEWAAFLSLRVRTARGSASAVHPDRGGRMLSVWRPESRILETGRQPNPSSMAPLFGPGGPGGCLAPHRDLVRARGCI
ncbi:hypothetical protein MTO96_000830 [Rhipicephalus appendiculatus]